MVNPSRRTVLSAAVVAGATTTGLFATAPTAAAQERQTVKPPLIGTVTAVEPGSRTLRVNTIAHGSDVLVVLDAKAVVWRDRPAALADVAVRDCVAITGAWKKSVFIATVIEPLYDVAPGRYVPGGGVRLSDRDAIVGPQTVIGNTVGQAVGRPEDVIVTYRIDGRTGAAVAYRISS